MEGEATLRLGLTGVKGVNRRLAETLPQARRGGEFRSAGDLLAREALRRSLVVIEGVVSRQDGTLNLAAERAWPLGRLDGAGGRPD